MKALIRTSAILFALATATAQAELRLSSVFSDNMVLP